MLNAVLTGMLSRGRPLAVRVIGCWWTGSTIASDAQRVRGTSPAMVMDVNEELGVPWTTSYEAVLSDKAVDAVFHW